MDRSGIMEIRKLFSKYVEGDSAAGNIAGCYIGADKEIKGEFSENLLTQEESVIRKYYAMFKKVLPNNMADIEFSGSDKGKDGIQFLLDKINGTDLKNKELLRVLYEKIADGLPETQHYGVLLVQYAYSVPIKTSDKQKIDGESDENYKFVLCAVCPVKTEKGNIGYDDSKDVIGENPVLRSFDTPAFGFLYPAFIDRSSDEGKVAISSNGKLDLSESLLGQQADIPVKETKPRTKKEKALAEGVADIPDFYSKDLDKGNAPSLDTGFYAPPTPEIRLKEEEKEEKREKVSGGEDESGNDILLGEVPKKHSAGKRIRIVGGRDRVKKKVIDGTEYFLVPVSDSEVE